MSRPGHRRAPRAGAIKTKPLRVGLPARLDSPCARRHAYGGLGYSQFRRPVSFLLSRTGVMVLSGVSKSCRNMAAGAGAAMSRTRSPVKGPATKEARSPEPRPSGTGENQATELWKLRRFCAGPPEPGQDTAFPSAIKLVPSTHIRCMMTASLRATATLARRAPEVPLRWRAGWLPCGAGPSAPAPRVPPGICHFHRTNPAGGSSSSTLRVA